LIISRKNGETIKDYKNILKNLHFFPKGGLAKKWATEKLDCFPKANLRQDKSLPASFIFSNFFSLGIKCDKIIMKNYEYCQTY
jgi:hypothetical protein